MINEKLSEWWDTLLKEPIKVGSTVFQMDTKYLPEIKQRMKSLEAENEAFSKTIDNLVAANGDALAENQRLSFLVDHYNNSFKTHYDRAEKAESCLKEAEKLGKWWKNNLPFNNNVFNSYILSFVDELEKALRDD